MDLKRAGRTMSVSEGSKGIGLGRGQAFAAEGARVIIGSRERANVDAALSTLPLGHDDTAELVEAAAAARNPLGRLAELANVAQAVLFLVSLQASYLTGVDIAMDGAAKLVAT